MSLRILLINNKQAPQTDLEKFLRNYGKVEVVYFQSISILSIIKAYIKRTDVVVLSGAGEVPLGFSIDMYKDELELIKTSPFPIIGICFGFEAIVAAYDEKLVKKENKITGIHDIQIKDKQENLKVWQSHTWCLEKSEKLEVLGESENGIEIVKVPNKKIYGLQFHPEHEDSRNNGKEIFEDILKKITDK